MSKPKIHVIKTNGPRYKRKRVKKSIQEAAQSVDVVDARGFTMVLFDASGEPCAAYWDTECLGPASSLRGELSKQTLDRVATRNDVINILEDDERE